MTTHTKCRICRKDIVLVPSAKKRSIATGEPESHFLELFTTHPECFIEERKKDSHALVKRINNEGNLCKLSQYQKLNTE